MLLKSLSIVNLHINSKSISNSNDNPMCDKIRYCIIEWFWNVKCKPANIFQVERVCKGCDKDMIVRAFCAQSNWANVSHIYMTVCHKFVCAYVCAVLMNYKYVINVLKYIVIKGEQRYGGDNYRSTRPEVQL